MLEFVGVGRSLGQEFGRQQRQREQQPLELGREAVDDALRVGAQAGIGHHPELHSAAVR